MLSDQPREAFDGRVMASLLELTQRSLIPAPDCFGQLAKSAAARGGFGGVARQADAWHQRRRHDGWRGHDISSRRGGHHVGNLGSGAGLTVGAIGATATLAVPLGACANASPESVTEVPLAASPAYNLRPVVEHRSRARRARRC
jgi:hypothetical protein